MPTSREPSLADPTIVHLVRHAAHALLPHTLAGRLPGVPLSPDGQDQAASVATRFATAAIVAVISSPVQRARETAAAIAAACGLDVAIDPAFEEIDFGAWTGRRFDALASDTAWQSWNRLRSLTCCPGGESMHQAQSRALRGLARVRERYAGSAVVVVSHADLVKAALAPALGLSLDHLHRLTIDPASVSTLVLFDDDMRVDGVNRVCG